MDNTRGKISETDTSENKNHFQITRKMSVIPETPSESVDQNFTCVNSNGEAEVSSRKISLMELESQCEQRWRGSLKKLSDELGSKQQNLDSISIGEFIEIFRNEVSMTHFNLTFFDRYIKLQYQYKFTVLFLELANNTLKITLDFYNFIQSIQSIVY